MQRENKNHQLRNLYPAKLYFKSEGEIKTLSNKLNEFIISSPDLQESFQKFFRQKKIIHIRKLILPIQKKMNTEEEIIEGKIQYTYCKDKLMKTVWY